MTENPSSDQTRPAPEGEYRSLIEIAAWGVTAYPAVKEIVKDVTQAATSEPAKADPAPAEQQAPPKA